MSGPDFSLTQQTALITGATQGLGLAIAQAFGAKGATVLINGRHQTGVARTVQQLHQQGIKAAPMVLDLSQLPQHAIALSAASKTSGTPTILVNNVGVRLRKPLAQFSAIEIQQFLQVNLVAAINLSRLFAEQLIAEKRPGRIITVSSIAGPLARLGDAVYPIAKQGLEAMVRSLAVEYGPHGINSNGIAPGTFATETNQAIVNNPEISSQLVGRNPLGRWGDPVEIAGPAVFLASAASSYVNGHILVVDGGYSIAY